MSTEELDAAKRKERYEHRQSVRDRFKKIIIGMAFTAFMLGVIAYHTVSHDKETARAVMSWWISLYMGSSLAAMLWFRRAHDPEKTWVETFKSLGPIVVWVPLILLSPFSGHGFHWARVAEGVCCVFMFIGLIIYLIKGKIDSDRETREELAETERVDKMIRGHAKKPD